MSEFAKESSKVGTVFMVVDEEKSGLQQHRKQVNLFLLISFDDGHSAAFLI